MPGWLGPWELVILLVVVVFVFGAKRIPELGRSLGSGMREFKDSVTGKTKDEQPALPPADEAASRADSERSEQSKVS
jgi:sec-independent protein translocase protein TatA